MKKCKWCGQQIEDKNISQHEEECNLNDGGASDLNYEEIANAYFD